MASQAPNSDGNFWRARYARKCVNTFQLQQTIPYMYEPGPVISLPGAQFPVPPGQFPTPPSDRPPLHPIICPVPILQPLGNIPSEKADHLLVGIIGAGAAGLYTALILDDLGIKYEILEGSDHAGGRVFTHKFNGCGEWNYFDVGAMRFPETPIMWRIFDLIRNRLNIGNKLLPYIMSSPKQFLCYNSIRVQQEKIDKEPKADHYNDCITAGGLVPPDFVNKGVAHWFDECYGPFRKLFVRNWEEGWVKLMEYDHHSTRSFMATAFDIQEENFVLKKDSYPDPAINWLERNIGTGLFDMAFSEMVIDSLEFDYPTATSLKYGADLEDPASFKWKWYCLSGGSHTLIKEMLAKIPTPQYSKRVTKIEPSYTSPPLPQIRPLSVSYTTGTTTHSKSYDYVISTIPLSVLRYVDVDRCNLSYAQREGMRTLRYGSSCKIGIKFTSRWWQNLGTGSIIGGQSKTDRVIRTAVFPSYGIADPKADAVMIASYTWSQDALRVGGLCSGRDHPNEQFLIDHMLEDLAVLHGVTYQFLKKECQDWFAFDWYANPFTLGAFGTFGPGQFKNIYPAWGQGAAGGRLLFAGEVLSDQHAWVEGALDSAYEAVYKMLEGAKLEDLLQKLKENWSNKQIPKHEEEEYQTLLQKQELIGAVLSTTSDFDEIKKIFSRMSLEV
ncbi:hypothetical protein VNI00_006412 [Paramarasmius palmivorus]|uniref:Amine oxidase domain-containing protein n=1 Tax=Paramarasmius palmivorus TaxID=297713 RepID=A0AAW0DB76_9AGAR